MSTDSWACRWGYLVRAIENRANKKSTKIELFGKVYLVLDIWGVGIIGPQLFLRVGHDPDVHELAGGKGLGVIKGRAESSDGGVIDNGQETMRVESVRCGGSRRKDELQRISSVFQSFWGF